MNCPKCGLQIKNLHCNNCGFNFITEEVYLLGINSRAFFTTLSDFIRECLEEKPQEKVSKNGITSTDGNPKPTSSSNVEIKHNDNRNTSQTIPNTSEVPSTQPYNEPTNRRSRDQEIADAVSQMIERIGIGTVRYSEECAKQIHDARWAYNALTVDQRTLVDHYSWLTRAEAEYRRLQAEAEQAARAKKGRIRTMSILLLMAFIGVVARFVVKGHLANQGNNLTPESSAETAVAITTESDQTGTDQVTVDLTSITGQQILLGNDAIYIVNSNGTVTASLKSESKEVADYSGWEDIKAIQLIQQTYWYNESLVGLRSDGTVIAEAGARTYPGEVDVSAWKNIIQIDTTNGQTVLGLTADGSILASPAIDREGSGIIPNNLSAPGCSKILAFGIKDIAILGITLDGRIIAVNPKDAPHFFYHENWGKLYLEWDGIADAAICSNSKDLFGLTTEGQVLYGGTAGYSGELLFDEKEINSWSNVTAIAAGGRHLVALRSDGTVLAAGDNRKGQCDVSDWTNIIRIEAYENSTVGYSSNGKIHTAGNN